MIARRFLAWARIAPAGARADATSAMARAFLFSHLSDEDRYEAEIALTVMLDDPSPLVHCALAEAVASAADVPHHLLTGLVSLGGAAAAIVLRRTRLLAEVELVDAAAIGAETSQIAIAERRDLPVAVSAALAEVACLDACVALAGNPSAEVNETSMLRLLGRFGADARLREALLARDDLPARVRERLVREVGGALQGLLAERGWLGAGRAERLVEDAQQRAMVTLACDPRLDPAEVIACLRETARLTPAFVVHALLAGEIEIVAAALADLSRVPQVKVAAFLREERQAPLAALLGRAGIPDWLAPLFPLTLAELRSAAVMGAGATPATPMRVALRRIARRIETLPAQGGSAQLLSYLRRLEAEAARGEARALAEAMIQLDEDEIAAEMRRLIGYDAEVTIEPDLAEGPDPIDLEAEPTAIDLDATAVTRSAA